MASSFEVSATRLRVAAALAPLVAELVAGLRDGLDRRKIGLEGAA